jgi:capsular exopolysaccharide synthesis family protein
MGKMQEALRKAEEERARRTAAGERPVERDVRSAAGGGFGTGLATSVALATGPRLGDIDPHLVALTEPESEKAEQYRTLRTNILAMSEPAHPKVVVVTSSVHGEGKSITTANLACSLAEESGKRIVVVDADMRKPTMQKLLGIDNQRGLADYLCGGTILDMVLQRTRLPNLWAVPAGRVPPNPGELLGGRGMDDLIARLRRDYDHVLIDATPIGGDVDAAVLSPRADVSLLVVRMGSTHRDVVRNAVAALHRAGAKAIGSVLTAVDG